MTKTLVLLAAVLAFTAGASAQTAVSPQKQQLVDQILQAQQGGIDQLARQLVEQPAVQLLQRAAAVVRRNVAADQQQAMGQALQDDVRKYAEDTFPIVRDRARALAPSTLGPVMAEKLTEAELQEVLAVFKSEAWRKFQGLAPEMQKALGEKLVADIKPQMETRLKALDQTMGKRLGLTQPAAASGAAKGK
jgi:uncharacterized protein